MQFLSALFIGIIFGAGLTIANMINPNKILNFLDFFDTWDPTLLVVMVSALLVTFIGYRLVEKRKRPILDEEFHLPQKEKIDKRLIIGSAIFGVGWGMAGYCPGPAITALALLNPDTIYFVVGLLAGSFVFWLLKKE